VSPGPLLAVLVLVWAISWPVIKVGVSAISPIWFACLRYAVATTVLFVFAAARHELRLPQRSDRRLVLVSGILQMGIYAALTSAALTRLPAGRASVLAFSTPLWVALLAAWRGQERLTPRSIAGIGVGLLGITAIAAPSIHQRGGGALAYGMLLVAAISWAVSIVFVRGHRFSANPAVLAPWQTLAAFALLLPVALATEGTLLPIRPRGFIALLYVGTVATAFAYWAVVEVGRQVKATTLSVALLATPGLGLLISALTQGERIGVPLIVGMVMIAGGIRLTIRKDKDQQMKCDLPVGTHRTAPHCAEEAPRGGA
jgi:drug/metabolite transporter (DMT)-like permease